MKEILQCAKEFYHLENGGCTNENYTKLREIVKVVSFIVYCSQSPSLLGFIRMNLNCYNCVRVLFAKTAV